MDFSNRTLDADAGVLALGLRGAWVIMNNLSNRESCPEFQALQSETAGRLARDLTPESIDADPTLDGFRAIHTAIGFSNRTHIASPENLLGILLRTGRLTHIHLLVDIYNLVSVETRLALGAHDLSRVDGNVHLRMLDGRENFCPLGAGRPKPVRAGGYAYVDDANDVLCMLEVRQGEKTKTDLETTDCLFIVQGNAHTSPAFIAAATQRLVELTQRFCGGSPVTQGAWG